MTENHDYLRRGQNSRTSLIADITLLMLKGAAFAAIFCTAIWFLIGATYWVGKMLPEESRETEDPTPFSHLLGDQNTAQS
ncbi:MAG: RC-LH1 core complex protein PufX [Aliishimia sp.]